MTFWDAVGTGFATMLGGLICLAIWEMFLKDKIHKIREPINNLKDRVINPQVINPKREEKKSDFPFEFRNPMQQQQDNEPQIQFRIPRVENGEWK